MVAKVLLVDNDPNLLESYRRQLKTFFQFEIAETAETALEVLRKYNDIAVVVATSLQFLEEIKSNHPNLIRIMLTAQLDNETLLKAINTAGVSQLLTKPCSSILLKDVIQKSLESFKRNTPSQKSSSIAMSRNIESLKEKLSQQKKSFLALEKSKNSLILKYEKEKSEQDTLLKKQLEEEKLGLLKELKALEENNNRLRNTIDATQNKKEKQGLKKELETIEGILANERKMQEKLLQEKNDAVKMHQNLKEKLEVLKKELELTAKLQGKDEKEVARLKDELALLKEKIEDKQENEQRDKSTGGQKKLEKKIEVLMKRLKAENDQYKKSLMEKEQLEKEIIKQEEIIKNLRNELKKVNDEIKDMEALQQEIREVQGDQGRGEDLSKINGGELSDVLKTAGNTFDAMQSALNHKTSFDDRIKKLDSFIDDTKEHIEKIVYKNNESTSEAPHSLEFLNFLEDQVNRKNKVKQILIEQKQGAGDEEGQSIIIQNKINKKHAAHGGSWKVAYADFVTAMMAFFLLMWLLSQLSQDSRDNLQEYFKSYKAFKHSGKEPVKQSDSIRHSDDQEKMLNQKRMIEEFKQRFKGHDDHFRVEEAAGGVRVQIMDQAKEPMFEIGSARFTALAKGIMEYLAIRINELPGDIIIEGHTDGVPYSREGKSNWELSMERASTARLYLVKNGVDKKRIRRIVAFGFAEPLNAENVLDPRNRRINIIIKAKDDIECCRKLK